MTQAAILAAFGSPGTTTGFKNKIMNGAMVVAQRGTSFTGVTGAQYTLDRFSWGVAATGTWTVTQDTSAPPGFTYSLKAVCTATTGSPNQLRLVQVIEGYNVTDLGYGTSSAKSTTFSFWIKTNKTGTYAVSVETSTGGIYYHTTFTVSAADTWEQKTITISGSTAYSLNTTNGSGLQFSIWFAGGSGVTGGSLPANTWLSDGTYTSIAAGLTVNLADSTSNYVNITGVQLEVGTTATNFDFRSYGTELQLCQRYYQQIGAATTNGVASGGYSTIVPYVMYTAATSVNGAVLLITEMRATPSVSYTAPLAVSTGAASYPITSIGITTVQSDNRYVSVNFTASGGGIPSGTPLRLEQNGTTAGALLISSEL